MADNKDLKKFRGGIRLESTSAPANAETGALYFDSVAKGLKVHDGDQFNDVGSGSSGGLDTFYVEDFRAQTLDVNNSGVTKFVRTGSSLSFESDADEISEKSLKITLGTTPDELLSSPEIVLNNRQKGQTCSISFYYKTDTFVDDDMKLEVFSGTSTGNVTTSLLSEDIKATTSIKKFVTTFTIPSDATHLQYKFKNKSNSGTKLIYVDDVEISQDPFVQADLGTITDWKVIQSNVTTYFPGLNGGTTGGSGSPPSGMNYTYRRVGDSLEVNIHLDTVGQSGGSNNNPGMNAGHSNTAAILLPDGLEVDFTKAFSAKNIVGSFQYGYPSSDNLAGHGVDTDSNASTIQEYTVIVKSGWYDLGVSGGAYGDSKNYLLLTDKTGSASSGINLVEWGSVAGSSSGNSLKGQATIPIKGWGSTNTHIVTPAKSNLTDWVSYTPATSWGNVNPTGKWRRVGDSMEIQAKIEGAGTPAAAALTIDIPSGYTVDTSKLEYDSDAGGYYPATGGNAVLFDDGVQLSNGTCFLADTSNTIQVRCFQTNAEGEVTSGNVSTTFPFSFTTDDSVIIHCSFPITGWSTDGTDHFLAALPMTKWQRKNMSTSVVDGNAWVHKGTNTGFKFENLTVGKTYKLTLNAQVQVDKEDKDAIFSAYHGGTTDSHALIKLVNYRSQDPPGSADYTPGISEQHKAGTVIFTAVSGTDVDGNTGCFVHFYWSASAGQIGGGSSGYERTFAILEEISMHEETDIW